MILRRILGVGLVLAAALPAVAQYGQQTTQPAPAQPQLSQVPVPAPPAPSAQELADLRRIEEIGRTNPEQVTTLVEEFLAKYPESLLRSRAYAAGSAVYRLQGNLAKSVEYAEKGLELAPNDAMLILQLADGLVEGVIPGQAGTAEKLARSETLARRALELMPELLAGMDRRPEVPAEEYERQQSYVESLPHSILGSIAFKQQQYRQAADEFKLATELNPANAVDFAGLGVSRMMLGEWTAAKVALEQCLTLSPAGSAAAEFARQRLETVEKNLASSSSPRTPNSQE